MTRENILQEIAATKSLANREIDKLSLSRVDFSGCNLEQAVFRHCRFRESSFIGANLTGVHFEHCLFQDNRFDNATVSKTYFIKCQGLPQSTLERLIHDGAFAEEPDSHLHPIIGGAAVVLVALALFLVCGGYKLFTPPSSEDASNAADETTPDESAQLLRTAREQYEAGHFPEAVEIYRSLKTRLAGDVSFLIEFAQTCDRAGQYDCVTELVEQIRRESKREDEKLQGEMLQAGAWLRQEKIAEGMAAFDGLLQANAGDLASRQTILRHQGTVLMQTSRHAAAVQAFERLIDISEPNQVAGVWILIALVHQESGNPEAANEALAHAAEDPNAPAAVRSDALIKQALSHLSKGDWDVVANEVFATLEQGGDPGQVLSAVRRLQEALTAAGHPEKIEPLYRRLLAAFENVEAAAPRNDARVDLANLLLEQKRPAEALALYRQVAEESPNKVQQDWARDMVEEMRRNTPAPSAGQ